VYITVNNLCLKAVNNVSPIIVNNVRPITVNNVRPITVNKEWIVADLNGYYYHLNLLTGELISLLLLASGIFPEVVIICARYL